MDCMKRKPDDYDMLFGFLRYKKTKNIMEKIAMARAKAGAQ
jgi:hypothetical protein